MTALALRNPIAILMLCIGLCVFAVVVTPRLSVDTFPELTPPVLVIGTQAPGLGPKDIEKTIAKELNYLGFETGISGAELTTSARRQAERFAADAAAAPRAVGGCRRVCGHFVLAGLLSDRRRQESLPGKSRPGRRACVVHAAAHR